VSVVDNKGHAAHAACSSPEPDETNSLQRSSGSGHFKGTGKAPVGRRIQAADTNPAKSDGTEQKSMLQIVTSGYHRAALGHVRRGLKYRL
jgi:hypothetical protein